MYSASKTLISLELAREIVRRHFGTGLRLAAFEELKDGFFNAAYLLELENGPRCVLKVAPPESIAVLRYEKGILRTEWEVLALVKQHTEMPVPEVLFYDPSHSLLENDYYLMDFVPGVPLNKVRNQLQSEEQWAIDYQAGQYLRQVNEIAGDYFGYPALANQHFHSWRAGFEQIVKDVLADGEAMQVALPVPCHELYTRLKEVYPVLDEVVSPRLVHWDLWDGNIFIDLESKRISGMIDFERALWADPLMECNFGAMGGNPAFLAGYGQEMLDTPAKRCRRILYDVYLFLIMVIECYYRQYETRDQENWAREQLARQLDRLDSID